MLLQSKQQYDVTVDHTSEGLMSKQTPQVQHLTHILFERASRWWSYLEIIYQRCAAGMLNLSEGKERNLHRQDSKLPQLYVIICQYTLERVESVL